MGETQQVKKGLLLVVVGPTAVGKTELCIKLAQHYKTVIVSADSRQFYKEMTIGTAKPSLEEMQGVPHYFINSHHIHEEYNAGAYEQDALLLLKKLFEKYQIVILTGGSGLYLRAILEGIDEMPEVPAQIRQDLKHMHLESGLEPLLEKLKELDLVYYEQVDKANPQRIIRALEVSLATNQPYSSFRTAPRVQRFFTPIKIGLNRPREELYNRINKRVDFMLQGGLVEEVKSLYSYKHLNALQTVGYQEYFHFLDGLYDEKEAERLLKRNSRRYAKRQLTWFSKDPDISWFHPEQWDDIISYVKNFEEGS